MTKLTGGLKMLAKQRKVDIQQGVGKFISDKQIEVTKEDGSKEVVEFQNAIIAAGSRPVKLPFLPEDPRIIDSTGALELEEVSGKMLVIGGGIIGLEMATVYHALGSEITVVELMDQVIPGADSDIVAPLYKRIKSQKILSINERHHSMGEFADIISHELNHPLAVISNYLYGCIRRLEAGKFEAKDVIDALKRANDQSRRINEIILRMKNFTCKGTMSYETIDINNLMSETITLIKHEHATYPVSVHYYPLQNSPSIMLDKIHIQQVIVNLTRNAIESMRDAGRTDAKIFLEAYHHNQDKIEINIIDNGPGIHPDHIHQLFNPYFTTKTYGIGLGLAISRKIIEAHGGVLSAEKHPLGTCFKFTLLTKPLSQDLLHQFGSHAV